MSREINIQEPETTKAIPVSSQGLVVSVAIPLGAGSLFSYLVPTAMEEEAVPGVRVLVPFGNRHLVGLVVAREDGKQDLHLKSLISVLDCKPVMGGALLELGKWLSWYYMSPPGEMFRCMLPPGLLAKKASPDDEAARHWPIRTQSAVVGVNETGDSPLTPRQQEILQAISGMKLPLMRSGLARQLGCSESLLNKLRAKGCLVTENVPVDRSPWGTGSEAEAERHRLNSEQSRALEEITGFMVSGISKSVLLHGVTACGKTEVYLRAIENTLELGRTALTLVPEIGLTPQVSGLFRSRFGEQVAILHSRLSAGERFDQWRKIRDGAVRVAVGTRSAVFAPLENIGLIIVDEEHDSSYKQGDQPRYNARDTALKRGRLENAVVVLGSATPQLETFNNAVHRNLFHYIQMENRILARPLPSVDVVDMCEEFRRHGRDSALSGALREKISQRLIQGEQVLVLLNRRGYAALILCRSCGYTEICENCSIRLTYHQRGKRLLCHYCGFSKKAPESCPQCGKHYIHYHGDGTERVQEELEELFPEASVDRLDRDTTGGKGGFDRILGRFRRRETDILVGTQMIAKGHDFPGVTLVGVLNGDQGLGIPDFRAVERTFQLLTQVSGRAGRGRKPGEVIIQTYNPGHYGIRCATEHDYVAFARKELLTRKRFSFPPYVALANLIIRGGSAALVKRRASDLARILRRLLRENFSGAGIRILGPAPSALEKLEKEFRYQVIIKASDRKQLHQVVGQAMNEISEGKGNPSGIYVDIDPVDLM